LSEGSELLSRLLSSEVKGDLLVLFHKNPGLTDTVDAVARRIGRIASAAETDVEDLVKLGILGKRRIDKLEVVFLSREVDKRIQESIAEHVRGLEKGEFMITSQGIEVAAPFAEYEGVITGAPKKFMNNGFKVASDQR